jgi:hypothetical protein
MPEEQKRIESELVHGSNRIFKPGVYTHFKEGTKYLAYEDTTDEETQLPRISYFAIDKPSKKWSRKQEVFLAAATQNKNVNKTGQEFKFEFLSNEYPLFIRPIMDKDLIKIKDNTFSHLHIDDTVKIVIFPEYNLFENLKIITRINTIGHFGITTDMQHGFLKIEWHQIQELYKIYDGV